MTTAKIYIHAFKVSKTANSVPLETLINTISNHRISDRIRTVITSSVRIDRVKTDPINASGEKLTYIDFVKLRDTHGPGKASKDVAVNDIALAPDEYFGEETAALYIPQKKWLITQYNHYGVRPSAMAGYFSSYAANQANSYELTIKLDPDAQRRFLAANEVRRFEMALDLTKMRAKDRQQGIGLGTIAAIGADLDGAKLKITISVGTERKRRLTGRVKDALTQMIQHTDMVTSAQIAGRETPDGHIEVVDLLDEKLVTESHITIGPGRRLDQNERFRALAWAWSNWRNVL
ncbi:DUF6731 family protein [Rhodanobacter sp. A1T4]|uniref:DUF6731 family protein n=1 Tax=Rhodanobacter sp. A1T4 TaxID=2723087 RepID=UPI001611DDE2|nr:DUF6731 family protein [Rhodanobacter sp. A1T4]MBB6245692.1 hypothetical protein [Rhodanobacter sp. A1T4]